MGAGSDESSIKEKREDPKLRFLNGSSCLDLVSEATFLFSLSPLTSSFSGPIPMKEENPLLEMLGSEVVGGPMAGGA